MESTLSNRNYLSLLKIVYHQQKKNIPKLSEYAFMHFRFPPFYNCTNGRKVGYSFLAKNILPVKKTNFLTRK
jgi:hypothetical protein